MNRAELRQARGYGPDSEEVAPPDPMLRMIDEKNANEARRKAQA